MNTGDQVQKQIIERIKQFAEQRRELVSLPPETALDRILDAAAPLPLVHSFPEQDLYYLINDIGPEDALPLLAMASDKQLEYILDADVWTGDRIDLKSTTRWLNLLLQADPTRSIRWLVWEKSDLIAFYLNRNLEVIIREHDQDPSDFGDGFFTMDDMFYVRILDDPSVDTADEIVEKARKDTIRKFLTDLAAQDFLTYQQILMASPALISPETEEEAYRLRNVRLAEKGFLPFDEAVGVYQPLAAEDLHMRRRKQVTRDAIDGILPTAALYPVQIMNDNNLFSEALGKIRSNPVLQQLQTEFVGLCNQVIVADRKKIQTRQDLKAAVDKVSGYLTIGLRRLVSGTDLPEYEQAADWVQSAILSDIFRVGFGAALDLKWRAVRWRKDAWFEKKALPLSFWGEAWLGVLGGLLIKKPLYFDNYRSGEAYREFSSIEDIRVTGSQFDEIMAFDDLLDRMDLQIKTPLRFMTHKSMTLTAWARHCLGMSEAFDAVEIDRFKIFFDDLFLPAPGPDSEKPCQTRADMKTSLLDWLSEKSGMPAVDISRKLGHTLEGLFQEIESELGRVSKEDIDPKFIYLFHLKASYETTLTSNIEH
jgi:uncharacterized protein DUF6178